eukprot:9303676-Alexandrium_andersonii.AAC.1
MFGGRRTLLQAPAGAFITLWGVGKRRVLRIEQAVREGAVAPPVDLRYLTKQHGVVAAPVYAA